jgi:hypothetical protein
MPTTYAIPDGRTVMAATLFNGIAGGTQTINNSVNGVSFQPDFVWMKLRSGAQDHFLMDAVRGAANYVVSNTTAAEVNAPAFLTSFNSNGWSLGSGGYGAGVTVVGWQWKANGAAVTNTAGTISSQVSANTTAGFSVVTYTGNGINGATVGHGLGVAPSMIITKKRNSVGTDYGWSTYHVSNGTANIWLDKTDAKNPNNWNTAPTSTVFTPADLDYNNVNTATYVNYCFAAVPGYSAFGSYTGNGSSDGVFVYLGFRARFLMIKSTSTGGWVMLDTSRDPYNDVDNYLYANSVAAEAGSSNVLDINSNGFKIRNSWTDINGNGTSYIYMAFAENAFKFANAR